MKYFEDVYDYSVCWQMSPHERYACLKIIEDVTTQGSHPIVAAEIGTFCGGFLRHLDRWFDTVHVFDVTIENLCKPKTSFENSVFYVGDSRMTVPMAAKNWVGDFFPQLILIDANHEYDYVKADLQSVLFGVDGLPRVPSDDGTVILVHDSWYPPSRRAILDTKFSEYVHFVDLDFCAGTVLENGMTVGGLCLILLKPTPRTGELDLRMSDLRGWQRMSGGK